MGRKRIGQTRKRGGASTENKLGLVLGFTAAQGHTRNVVSKASEVSKSVRSNYLTETLRKKRINLKKNAFFKNYTEEMYGSKLHYAIKKQDPYAVKLVLPTSTLHVRHFNQTPLETAFSQLRMILDQAKDPHNALEIINILLLAKAPVTPLVIQELWSISNDDPLRQLLKQHPILKEKTVEFKESVLNAYDTELYQIERDIEGERSEFRRGENGGYGYVPQSFYDERSEILQKTLRLLEF